MGKLCLTGASGKLGRQVLLSLLENKWIDPSRLVVSTSSDIQISKFTDLGLDISGITIEHANFDDLSSLEHAFEGCERLLIVSTPAIQMDFHNAAHGEGREKHHFNAINAAQKVGVKHVCYTSLAFGHPSVASVMTAHIRTEEYLEKLAKEIGLVFTVIREGIYSESWPLYLGYYDLGRDARKEIILAGDGAIPWVSIADLGYATARILCAPMEQFKNKVIRLCGKESCPLKSVVESVSQEEGREVTIRVVSIKEYQEFYVANGKEGVKGNSGLVEWWSSTYNALQNGEANIVDDTLEQMSVAQGRQLKPFKATLSEMYAALRSE